MVKARTSWLTGAGARRIIAKRVFYARGNLLGTRALERLLPDTLKRGSLPSRQSRPHIQLVITPEPVTGTHNGSQHHGRQNRHSNPSKTATHMHAGQRSPSAVRASRQGLPNCD